MPYLCTSCTGRRWRCFVPSLFVWAGITWLSLIKAVPVPLMENIPLADKWGHMVAYMVFALCLAGDGYRAQMPVSRICLLAALLPAAYGGLIELVQPYFPPRQGEWLDWLADCIGVVAGMALFSLFLFCSNRRKARQQRAEQ